MVKAYQRYVEAGDCGLICGAEANTLAWLNGVILAGANDRVIPWSANGQRKGTGFSISADQKDAAGEMLVVTALTVDPETALVAVGYSDGSVRLFDATESSDSTGFAGFGASGAGEALLVGHRSAVTVLRFFPNNILLSGSKDTDVVAWDLVARSGICRFRGHTGEVTALLSMPGLIDSPSSPACSALSSAPMFISSSKDHLIKVWEVEGAQVCVQTAVAGNFNEEVYALAAAPGLVLAGCAGTRIAVYAALPSGLALARFLDRETTSGVVSSLFISGGLVVAAAAGSKRLECWRVQAFDAKDKRKANKKKAKQGSEQSIEGGSDSIVTLPLKFSKLSTFFAPSKIRSVALGKVSPSTGIQVALSLADNRIQTLLIGGPNHLSADQVAEPLPSRSIRLAGHREPVRSVEVSLDNGSIVSISSESVRLWRCLDDGFSFIKSIPVEQGVVARLLAGNQYILVATKTGSLELLDVAAEEVVASITAGEGAIAALERVPGEMEVFASVGSDKSIRYWQVGSKSGSVILSEIEERRGFTADAGTCLAFSSDKVAVGLLDSNIQLLHSDTHKLSLTLYGHKLPVTAIKFTSDGSLLVSGSADKSVKVWSPKFGNILKSFKAHEGTVTQLGLVPETHLLFSTGRDGSVALWDLDQPSPAVTTFSNAHRGEVWGLGLSADAGFIVTAGADRAIRKWTRTTEQLFAEEERDQREERENERELAEGDVVVMARASRKTVQTVRSAERLMELLEAAESIGGQQGQVRAAKLLTVIPPADLNEVLLALPATSARQLLTALADLLETLPASPLVPLDVLLTAGLTLVQAQARYLVAEPGIAPLMARLRDVCFKVVQFRRDRCNVTAAAVGFQINRMNKKRRL